MKELGISVYLRRGNADKNLNYIRLAHKYGFKRIFTCLISEHDRSVDETIADLKAVANLANELNMKVVADVEPSVFKRFGVEYSNLSPFKELGLYGIRLDLGFSGFEETLMTFNRQGIKIELNMSGGTKYIDNIMSYKPNTENILGCHNFYPHVYTGISLEHFIRCSRQFKGLCIPTAAFINSKCAEFGPWPVEEGLCTLEMHRNMAADVQAKHLFATGLIDSVIIANSYASEEELQSISGVNKDMLVFSVELVQGIPELEKKIVLEEQHFNRGDVSEYVARSTQSRVKYSQYEFPPFNCPDIKRGDILIESSLYTRYKGELQIALKDMKNSGKTNVVGRITEDEIFLLDYLEPWMKFGFADKNSIL